jgi:hypothetical protein
MQRLSTAGETVAGANVATGAGSANRSSCRAPGAWRIRHGVGSSKVSGFLEVIKTREAVAAAVGPGITSRFGRSLKLCWRSILPSYKPLQERWTPAPLSAHGVAAITFFEAAARKSPGVRRARGARVVDRTESANGAAAAGVRWFQSGRQSAPRTNYDEHQIATPEFKKVEVRDTALARRPAKLAEERSLARAAQDSNARLRCAAGCTVARYICAGAEPA